MRIIIIVIVSLCLLSCEKKTYDEQYSMHFEGTPTILTSKNIITTVSSNEAVAKISIRNNRKDTLRFITPYLFFGIEIKKEVRKDPNIVVMRFIPTVAIKKITTYIITKNKTREIMSTYFPTTEEIEQEEFKLPPQCEYIMEYLIDCRKSDPEKYKLFFIESNRHDKSKFEKIKFPNHVYLKIEK